MGRYYKIILSFVLAIFMMTNTIFAHEVNNLNLININYLLKRIETTKLKELSVCNLENIDKFYLHENNTNKSVKKISAKTPQNTQTLVAKKNNNLTYNKNNSNDIKEAKGVISLNNDQLNLLSKLVAAEARGESYEGQVAVAAVVLNRVKDSRFPDSIEGVIYQKNAFSVVKNGYIYINPTEESYKAAKEALYGNDPTDDAIYFWNPDISTCSWINTLNPHLRIGNHVFAR